MLYKVSNSLKLASMNVKLMWLLECKVKNKVTRLKYRMLTRLGPHKNRMGSLRAMRSILIKEYRGIITRIELALLLI